MTMFDIFKKKKDLPRVSHLVWNAMICYAKRGNISYGHKYDYDAPIGPDKYHINTISDYYYYVGLWSNGICVHIKTKKVKLNNDILGYLTDEEINILHRLYADKQERRIRIKTKNFVNGCGDV